VLDILPETVEATILPLGRHDRPYIARLSLPLPNA